MKDYDDCGEAEQFFRDFIMMFVAILFVPVYVTVDFVRWLRRKTDE